MDQKKRLAVGVEVVSGPSILFLDEPTTGAPAFASLHHVGVHVFFCVCLVVRCVLCVVHVCVYVLCVRVLVHVYANSM